MIKINLLPQKRRVERRAETSQLWLAVVLMLFLAEVAGLFVFHGYKNEQLQERLRSTASYRRRSTKLSTPSQNHGDVRQKLEQLRAKEDAIAKLQSARTGPTAVLLELAPDPDPRSRSERRSRSLEPAAPRESARRVQPELGRAAALADQVRRAAAQSRLEGVARDGEDVSELARRLQLSSYSTTSSCCRPRSSAIRRPDRTRALPARSRGEVLMARGIGSGKAARCSPRSASAPGSWFWWASPTSSFSTARSPATSKPPRVRRRKLRGELADARKAEFAYQKDLAGAHRAPATPARARKDPADHHRVPGVSELASVGRERRGRQPQRLDAAAGSAGKVLRARADEARSLRAATTRSPSSSTGSASSTASSTWKTSRSPSRRRTATSIWSKSRRSPRRSARSPKSRKTKRTSAQPPRRGASIEPRALQRLLRGVTLARSRFCRSPAAKTSFRARRVPAALRRKLRRRRPSAARQPSWRPPKIDFQEAEFAESERSRDPFRSYGTLFVEEARARVKSQRQVLLDQYSIDELKLIGIVTRIQPAKAMLVDPSGQRPRRSSRPVRRSS